MTREQMELLLNYLDAKLDLAIPPQLATWQYLQERRHTARKCRQELLASLPPASEN